MSEIGFLLDRTRSFNAVGVPFGTSYLSRDIQQHVQSQDVLKLRDLVAFLLQVSRLEQPIESLDDLAKQFKTKYAPQVSTATETYFRRMKDIEEKFYTCVF